MNTQSDKHEIFAGFKKEGTIDAKLLVGAAFKDDGTTYYKIRLMMFPGYTYYLVKDAIRRIVTPSIQRREVERSELSF